MKTKFTCIALLFYLFATAQLTKPKKFYVDSLNFEDAPKRVNTLYPLSDQENKGKWKFNKKFSDEFDGEKLDEVKWYPNNPGWKGRPPTLFHGSNVSLLNGELVFKINQHPKKFKFPKNKDKSKRYTHTSGFIKSKNTILYGYFEAEQKLMDAPWVSGFWMCKGTSEWWTEIDICENAPSENFQENDLNSNVHVFRSPEDQGNVKKHFSINKKYYIPFDLHKDYHTWGVEWNKDVIRFYIDGVLFREQENTHWHQPLEINFNNESNKWFGALPDKKKNSRTDREFRVKYFRVWAK